MEKAKRHVQKACHRNFGPAKIWVHRTIIFRKCWSTHGIMVRAQVLWCKHFNDTRFKRQTIFSSENFGPGDQNFRDQNYCDRYSMSSLTTIGVLVS